MDIIISALVFAIKLIGEKFADKGLEDAYESLKGKILKKQPGDSKAVSGSLEQLESNPSEARQTCLKEDLQRTGLAEDPELIKAAKVLLESSDEGRNILQQINQNQKVGKKAKAAQVSGNGNTVKIS